MTTAERLNKVAENQVKVYEAGKQAEYDRFWDTFQQNGNRNYYYAGFSSYGWTNETFKPKYSMNVSSAALMFYSSLIKGDLVELLDDLGVTLDFSQSTNMSSTFALSMFSRVGVVDITSTISSLSQLFYNCYYLETIDKLILRADGKNSFTAGNQFIGCGELKNITIEGVIGTGFNISYSPKLSKASITSIINALSTTTSGLTATFSKTATEKAFTADEWSALIATKTNWTISLV